MSDGWLFWDVDTQFDFMRPEGKLYVPDAESIVPALARLSETARAAQIPVVASACDHEPEDDEISDAPDFDATYPPHCLRGTAGAERIPETAQDWTLEVGHEALADEALTAIEGAEHPTVLIHKKHFDVFSNPNTESVLRLLAPRRVVVYGVALDVCNRAAVEGLLARGYTDVCAVTDATRPIRSEVAAELLADWADRGIELKTSDEVLAAL